MATGVTTDERVGKFYSQFKLNTDKRSYALFRIQDGKTIELEKVSEENETFFSFKEQFKPFECKYSLWKQNYTTLDGRPTEKLVFISWYACHSSLECAYVYC